MPFRMSRVLALTLGTLFASIGAQAQVWQPSKPIRILVVAAAGGLPDIGARTAAAQLTKVLGQSVIVENRAGGAGNIATEAVVRAAPDGHTLLATGSNQAANQILIPNPGFDYVRDLAPVAMLGEANMMIIASPTLAANNIRELIALAKAKPGTVAMAVSVFGSPNHVGAELLASMAGIDLNFIIYKGIGATLPDLMAGNVHLSISSLPAALGPVKSGRLKGLAVTRTKRAALMPEMPTVAEQGLPDFDINSWVALMAPGGTPKPIIERLNAEWLRALQIPEVQMSLTQQGMEAPLMSPEDLGQYIQDEVRKMTPILKNTKIKATN
jgi:tripartite-type tricarboxylate transporter receptor subunit TctC